MGVRRAGVIVIDIEARTSKFSTNIAQSSNELTRFGRDGRASVLPLSVSILQLDSTIARLNSTLSRTGASHQIAAAGADKSTESHRRAAGASKETHDSYLALGERALSLHHGYELLTHAIEKYTVVAVKSGGASDQIATAYRAIRLALSPTPFTVATIAAGILTEETIKLVMARAQLIDQQSVFAANNQISFHSVDALDTTSKIAGSNPGNVRSLYTGLQSEWSSNQKGVQGALDKLGVSGNVGDPAILGRIAAGFQSIQDPVKQAEIAFQLFGADSGKALHELDGNFARSAEATQKWGIALDEISRTQIHQFRQDLLHITDDLTNFSEMKAWWESFKTGTEIVAAAAEDMAKRGIHALDDLISSYIPGTTTLRAALTTLTPGIAAIFGKYGAAPIPAVGPPPVVPGAAQDTTGKQIYLQDSIAQEEARRQRESQTLEGQRKLQLAKKSESKQAFADAQNPKLTIDQRSIKIQEAQSAGMVAAVTARHVKEMEDAEQAAKDAAKAAEAIERILHQRFSSLAGELQSSAEKLLESGKPKSDQQKLQSNFQANKAVSATRDQIEDQGGTLSAANEARIRAMELGKATIEAEISWRNALATTTQELRRRIEVQALLNAAIGKGYEETKKATIETDLMHKFGEDYTNPARQGDINKIRRGMSQEYDSKRAGEVKQQLDSLRDQTDLEKALMAVQREGSEAVRQAELAYRLDQIAKNNDAESTKKLQAAEKELYAATQANHSAATVAKIADETAALKRFTAAAVEGAEAVRKAGAGNQFTELGKKGGSPVPGMIGVSQEQLAAAGQEQAQHEKEVTDAAFHRVNIYKDQLDNLNQQLAVLKEYQSTHQDDLRVAIAIRDIENEKLRTLSQEALDTGTLSGGLKSFLYDAAANAKKPGEILKDGLNHAVDGVSDELSKLMTGQKFDFGKMLQGLGQGILKDSLKSGMEQGLGALGKKLFPPNPKDLTKALAPEHRVTFRSGDAGHVLVDNWPGDGASMKSFVDHSAPVPTIASTILGYAAPVAGGLAGGLAGGGGSKESVTSSISYGGGRAAGGPVSPDTAYWVGEHGPEPFVPRTSGTIIPAGKLGGGDTHNHFTVDARGADLGAGNRVRQALSAVHKKAVSDAVLVMQERSQRVPH